MTETTKHILSQYAREHIDHWIKRYPADQKRSGVLEALRVVQEENGGSLTEELMNAVADYLGLPHIAVYEVATFYDMYYLEPMGKHVVEVCTNVSCMLNGSEKVVDHLKDRLGVDMNGTTPDGQFTLREVECLGACVNAPMCKVGHQYHENLTAEKLDKLLEEMSETTS